jgi:hypothetical protein
VSPFPSYEAACSHLNPMEMAHLKGNFKLLCKAGDSLTINQFTQVLTSVILSLALQITNYPIQRCIRFVPNFQNCHVNAACSKYIRKHIFPRLFGVVDQRRDSVIDFEEYLSAVALFRVGSTEEKIRGRVCPLSYTSHDIFNKALLIKLSLSFYNICRTVLFLMYEPVKGVTLMRCDAVRLFIFHIPPINSYCDKRSLYSIHPCCRNKD